MRFWRRYRCRRACRWRRSPSTARRTRRSWRRRLSRWLTARWRRSSTRREPRWPRRSSRRTMKSSVADAVRALARGEVVAIPTETYYGLAAAALDEAALALVLELKGREAERTLSVLIEPD